MTQERARARLPTHAMSARVPEPVDSDLKNKYDWHIKSTKILEANKKPSERLRIKPVDRKWKEIKKV